MIRTFSKHDDKQSAHNGADGDGNIRDNTVNSEIIVGLMSRITSSILPLVMTLQ